MMQSRLGLGLGLFLCSSAAWAVVPLTHSDPCASIVFWGMMLLSFGIVGRFIAKLMGQPGVLGELLIGVLVGNIGYAFHLQLFVILRDSATAFSVIQAMLEGASLKAAVHTLIPEPTYAKQVLAALSSANGHEWMAVTYVVDALSRYGVIFLLFMVGLESSLQDLQKTGKESALVASIGVIAPMILGLLMMQWIFPELSMSTAIFVAATLSATSVGITARVLNDMRKLNTREAKTILGAAMLDDILGLIILAIVSSLVIVGSLNPLIISRIAILALIFFPLSLWLGPKLLHQMATVIKFVDPLQAKLLTSFIFVMVFSWLATLVNMSTIIGAFVAGIILHDGFFVSHKKVEKKSLSIRELLAPFEAVFAPLFFILIGIQVRLETFLDKQVILFSVYLLAAAIIGKLLSGLGGNCKDDRWIIGIGMIPRGEVGLIFASVGKNLHIIPDALFSAMVVMVVVTTFITPVWMKIHYQKSSQRAA